MPSHDKHFYNTKNVSTILSIQSIPAKRFLHVVPFPLATKTRNSYQPPYHFLIEASWIFHARFSAKNSRKKVKSMDKKYLFLRKDGLCKSHWFMKVSTSWRSISKNYTPRYLTFAVYILSNHELLCTKFGMTRGFPPCGEWIWIRFTEWQTWSIQHLISSLQNTGVAKATTAYPVTVYWANTTKSLHLWPHACTQN